MLDKLSHVAHSRLFHLLTAVAFIIFNVVGIKYGGGINFLFGWGGGMAAVIATAFLVFKSQGYWAWMIVNAGLWTFLFFHTGLALLAWLQVAFVIFSVYGMIQWALVKWRFGVDFKVKSDRWGTYLALGLFILAVAAYWPQVLDIWWALQVGAVITAIAAVWMDAFRYKLNWLAWTLSNCFSAPLFLHYALAGDTAYWGVFLTVFIYQAINIIGYIHWLREERRLVAEGKVTLVGAAEVL